MTDVDVLCERRGLASQIILYRPEAMNAVRPRTCVVWPAFEEYGRLFSDDLWRTADHGEGVHSHVEKTKTERRGALSASAESTRR